MSETFCVYPWLNLHTNTDGRCKLCCHIYEEDYIHQNGQDLILGATPFDEIWNGHYMRDVRQKMLKGSRVAACKRCYEHEERGLQSSRQWANKTFLQTAVKDFIKSHPGETLTELPKHLELRLGHICNLKCNSCWSVSSRSLFKERQSILAKQAVPSWLQQQWQHEIKSVEQFDWSWYKSDEFLKFIEAVAPDLERLYLTGGEPTLIPENLKVLQTLIDEGNSFCHVAWTTNLMQWPEEFYKTLDFFESSEVQLSLDAFGERAHYLRYPSRWSVIERNFNKALMLPEKVVLKVYCVIQAWNILDLSNLLAWLRPFTQHRRLDFAPIFLEYPDQIHSAVWPTPIKEQAIESLKPFLDTEWADEIQSVISYLKTPPFDYSKARLQRMQEFIAINDKARNLKFEDYFPELAKVLQQELI